MQELLENLRVEFKSRQLMQVREEPQKVEATSLIQSFLDTHAKLAANGQNSMQLRIRPAFPTNLCIPLTNFKRVLNNLVSNALKHTTKGLVSVSFECLSAQALSAVREPFVVGADLDPTRD